MLSTEILVKLLNFADGKAIVHSNLLGLKFVPSGGLSDPPQEHSPAMHELI